MKRFGGVAALVVLIGGLTIAGQTQRSPLAIGVAGRANQHVSAAADASMVVLAWAASLPNGTTDIFSAVSQDSGASFGTPVRVNTVAGQASANTEQPPRVALVPRQNGFRDIVVAWTASTDKGSRILTAQSTDSGRSFSSARIVRGSEATGNRGWHSIAVDTSGRVHVVWLDHRDAPNTGQTHQHGTAAAGAPAADGVNRAQSSQVYLSSLDGSEPARGIARGVCYCCKTAVVGAGNRLFVAWRHVYPGNLRDIAFAPSSDGGRTFSPPVRISQDGWQLDGCPENGPTLVLDATQRVHVIWPTLVRQSGQETLKLFHASTRDGHTFTARSPLPVTSAAYHPHAIIGPNGTLFVAWDEFASGGHRLKVARGRFEATGAVRFEPVAVNAAGAALAPALAATSSHLLVAWTAHEASQPVIRVTRIPY